MKKMLSILLSVIMVLTMVPSIAFADSTNSLVMKINPYGYGENSIDTITWEKINKEYYFFLPSDCNLNELYVYFNAEEVSVGEDSLTSGEPTDVFANGGNYTVVSDSVEYSLNVMQSAEIPAMYIQVEKGIDYINADKSNKSKGAIRTYERSDNGIECTINCALKQIKGRGNSTWNYPKKPYNIKFDEKTALLGMPEAKKWTLLSSYLDPVSLKNPITWELSNIMGLQYGSEYRFVDLYINGVYMGTYIVCESVEVGKNRVNITDLEKATEKVNEKGKDLDEYDKIRPGNFGAPSTYKYVDIPNDPSDITGGYLFECEYPMRKDDEVSAFVSSRGQVMTLKAPEYASKAQMEYIQGYWQKAEDALYSENGYNSERKHYSEYFDIPSLIDSYIIQELSGNLDAGTTSTYFYKESDSKDSKIYAGPVWDYDNAYGTMSIRGDILTSDPARWVANRMNYNMTNSATGNEMPTIFNRFYQREEFRQAVSKRWSVLKRKINVNSMLKMVDGLAATTEASSIMNGIKWSHFNKMTTFESTVDDIKAYLTSRIQNLNKGFGKNGAQLYYDPNGGTGWTIETKIMKNGDTAIVNEPYSSNFMGIVNILTTFSITDSIEEKIKAPSENPSFAGWNTKKDGSGTSYQPGDKLKMKGTITLYAQWKPKAAPDPTQKKDPRQVIQSKARPFTNVLDSVKSVVKSKISFQFLKKLFKL